MSTVSRKPYPSDVTDEEWAFVAPYLTLMMPAAPQRRHDVRKVDNALRWIVRTGSPWRYLLGDLAPWAAVLQQAQRWIAAGCFEDMVHDLRALLREATGREADPTAVVLDARTLRGTPESGHRAGYDGHKKTRGSTLPAAVDTLGHLLALRVTPANAQERAQVGALADGRPGLYGGGARRGGGGARDRAGRGPVAGGRRPSRASCCCRRGGWWSGPSRGRRAFGGWPRTTSGCPPPWPGCISWPLPASCYTNSRSCHSQVHDTL